MCRSIKILRAPYSADVTEEELRAAARAYLRTVSGYRLPPAPAEAAFDRAVEAVTATTRDLLAEVEQARAKEPAALSRPAARPGWAAHRPRRPVTGQPGP